MLVGDAMNRQAKGLKSQTCFRCYTSKNFGGDNAAPCQDAKYVTHPIPRFLPTTNFTGWILRVSPHPRAQAVFEVIFYTLPAGMA
jgi:hypothetical protein